MPSEKRDDQPPQSGVPMFNRLARAGSGGLSAATIGWTLALCIVGGALTGIALDKHFGTQYWTPILLLLGVAAGFIQMFRTIGDANRLAEREAAANRIARSNATSVAEPTERVGWTTPQAVTESERVPSRPTRVPAPPTASFDAASRGAQSTLSHGAPMQELPSDISDDLTQLRKMLAEQQAEDDKGQGSR